MLTDHIAVGMPHLFGDPINRGDAGGQQLTGVGMPALTRPTVSNLRCKQMRLKKPVTHYEVVGMWQAAFGVQKHEVQGVLAYRLIVTFNNLHGFRFALSSQGIDLAQRVPSGSEQTHLAHRAAGFGDAIGTAYLLADLGLFVSWLGHWFRS